MAVDDLKSSPGTVKTGLQENAIGIPGILMQGIATIAPSFAILASFVFIVTYAGLSTPWAYLFGGVLLGLQALNAAQLAKVFRFDEEHGIFAAPEGSALKVGDPVALVPGYSPSTVNWYDAYHVVSGDVVTDIWPIIPRGPGHHGLADAVGPAR